MTHLNKRAKTLTLLLFNVLLVINISNASESVLTKLLPPKQKGLLPFKSPHIPKSTLRPSSTTPPSPVTINSTNTTIQAASFISNYLNDTIKDKDPSSTSENQFHSFYDTHKSTFEAIVEDYHLPTGSTLGLKSLKNRLKDTFKGSKSKKMKEIPVCSETVFNRKDNYNALCRRKDSNKLSYVTTSEYRKGFKFRNIYSNSVKFQNSILSKLIETYSCGFGAISGYPLCKIGNHFDSYIRLLSETLVITLNELEPKSTSEKLVNIATKLYRKVTVSGTPVFAYLYPENVKEPVLLDGEEEPDHKDTVFTHAVFIYPTSNYMSMALYMNNLDQDFGISVIFPQTSDIYNETPKEKNVKLSISIRKENEEEAEEEDSKEEIEDTEKEEEIRDRRCSKLKVKFEECTGHPSKECTKAISKLQTCLGKIVLKNQRQENRSYLQIQQYVDTAILNKVFNKISINDNIVRKVFFNVEQQLTVGAFLSDLVSAEILYVGDRIGGSTLSTPFSKFRIAYRPTLEHSVIW